MVSEFAQSVLTAALSAGGVILAALLAAYFAYRGTQRQSAWQHIFTKKFDLTANLLDEFDHFGLLLQLAFNIQERSKDNSADRKAGTYVTILEYLAHDEDAKKKWNKLDEDIVARRVESAKVIDSLLVDAGNAVLFGISRQCDRLVRLERQLELLVYDPTAIEAAVATAHRINNRYLMESNHEFKGINLSTDFQAWSQAVAKARKSLRKDLHQSSKSFRRAVRYSREWMNSENSAGEGVTLSKQSKSQGGAKQSK